MTLAFTAWASVAAVAQDEKAASGQPAQVGLKLLHPGIVDDSSLLDLLENELGVIGKSPHPHLLRYIGLERHLENPFIIREWIHGFLLFDLLRWRGSLQAAELGLLLESLALNPQASLENSHDLRFVLLGQRQQIRGMVGVRVRQKDHVESRNLFQRLRTHGVAHHKWVNQPNLATASRQRKRAVAEIGNLVSLGVDHQADLERRLEDVRRAGTRRALNYRAAAAPSFDANSE